MSAKYKHRYSTFLVIEKLVRYCFNLYYMKVILINLFSTRPMFFFFHKFMNVLLFSYTQQPRVPFYGDESHERERNRRNRSLIEKRSIFRADEGRD